MESVTDKVKELLTPEKTKPKLSPKNNIIILIIIIIIIIIIM